MEIRKFLIQNVLNVQHFSTLTESRLLTARTSSFKYSCFFEHRERKLGSLITVTVYILKTVYSDPKDRSLENSSYYIFLILRFRKPYC